MVCFPFCLFSLWLIIGCESATAAASPKVVLYTGSSGGRKSFTSVAKNYPDLSVVNFDNVAKSGCLLGTWIFYGSKNYANFSDGVRVQFSKNNGCFTFQNLTQKVSSLRYAGSSSNFKADFIDLYSGVFFTGAHLRTEVSVANLTSVGLSSTTSIIVSGSSSWALFSNESYTGTTRCVSPKNGQVPRFYRNTLDIGEVLPKSIKKGC